MITKISRNTLIFCGLLTLPVGLLIADTEKQQRQVSVQGHGKVSATPDQALLWVQVSEEGTRVDAVTQQARSKMDAVVKAIKGQGVQDKDIQTQLYQVAPKIQWKNGRADRVGYTVSNRVQVKIRDLKKAGSVLAAVADAGANEITGPQFGFDNPQELERKALGLALADAKAKAALLADAAGAALGEAIRIDESGSFRPPVPRPMMAMRAMAAPAASEEVIASGEEPVEATVTASFALK